MVLVTLSPGSSPWKKWCWPSSPGRRSCPFPVVLLLPPEILFSLEELPLPCGVAPLPQISLPGRRSCSFPVVLFLSPRSPSPGGGAAPSLWCCSSPPDLPLLEEELPLLCSVGPLPPDPLFPGGGAAPSLWCWSSSPLVPPPPGGGAMALRCCFPHHPHLWFPAQTHRIKMLNCELGML